jgi:hypothetical protein
MSLAFSLFMFSPGKPELKGVADCWQMTLEETKDQKLMSDGFLYFAFPTVGQVKAITCLLGLIQGK